MEGETISQAQSGGSASAAASGMAGSRSRRQPARSGTRTSSPKCSSGSSRIHQPPGAVEPSGGPPKVPMSAKPIIEDARVWGNAGRGLVKSSPSIISATRWSGTLQRSSYVARRRPLVTCMKIACGPEREPRKALSLHSTTHWSPGTPVRLHAAAHDRRRHAPWLTAAL